MADIQLTFTVPNHTAGEASAKLKEAMLHHGWKEQIEDPENPGQLIDNPETHVQYWKKESIKFARDQYLAARDATNTASGKSQAQSEHDAFTIE